MYAKEIICFLRKNNIRGYLSPSAYFCVLLLSSSPTPSLIQEGNGVAGAEGMWKNTGRVEECGKGVGEERTQRCKRDVRVGSGDMASDSSPR